MRCTYTFPLTSPGHNGTCELNRDALNQPRHRLSAGTPVMYLIGRVSSLDLTRSGSSVIRREQSGPQSAFCFDKSINHKRLDESSQASMTNVISWRLDLIKI